MKSSEKESKIYISFWQIFLLAVAQMGGASVIYLPGAVEAGKNVWISNIVASIVGYMVIFFHSLPMSLCPG